MLIYIFFLYKKCCHFKQTERIENCKTNAYLFKKLFPNSIGIYIKINLHKINLHKKYVL